MGYEPHTWSNGELITASRMNAMEQGIANGGYDIVVSTADSSSPTSVSSYSVDWDYQDVLAKVRAGELVVGCLYVHYNYDFGVTGDTCIDLVPMNNIVIYANEASMSFSTVNVMSSSSSTQLSVWATKMKFSFNPSDGTLLSVSRINKQVNLS